MQIFQWLFKAADEQGVPNCTTSKDQEDKPEGIIPNKKNNNNRRSKSKKLKPIIFLCNKDIAKPCFYTSIYLKKVDSSSGTTHHRQQPHSQAMMKMKMKKEGSVVVSHKSDSSRVSPLSEAQVAVSSSTNARCHLQQCSGSKEKKDKKPKTMSRMKQLLRWAASSAKSEKGEGNLSKKVDGRRLSISESPKISLRWDVESCSSVSSAISGISVTCSSRNDEACNLVSLNSTFIHGLNRCSGRRGNWITTDSECKALPSSYTFTRTCGAGAMRGDGREKLKFAAVKSVKEKLHRHSFNLI
ncbi:hypothetical protein V6N13_140402 [Hibiscus sabdariffa]|uniref:Uncharacterized protein n=1 Tax=Hibiscus sabdariffa TaxID=183260 RepID=A0ABR2QA86_9ROSI